MTDLHTLLLAAISAREERARRALDINLSGRWAIQSNRTQSPAELSAVADFWQAETSAVAVLRQTTRDRRVLERHEAHLDGMDRLVCACCEELCHSRSGLMCDSPDAPWPCLEIRDMADAYAVALPAPLPEESPA